MAQTITCDVCEEGREAILMVGDMTTGGQTAVCLWCIPSYLYGVAEGAMQAIQQLTPAPEEATPPETNGASEDGQGVAPVAPWPHTTKVVTGGRRRREKAMKSAAEVRAEQPETEPFGAGED